ncbi:MAG: hypothetical protein ACLP4V_29350 [Methylocella sp.]
MSKAEMARMATARIKFNRENGSVACDEELVKQDGFRDTQEYWEAELSEPVTVRSFVELLAAHNAPSDRQGRYKYELEMLEALVIAAKAKYQWIIETKNDRLILDPRAAANYLSSLQKREHLVPGTLKAFLKRSDIETAPVVRHIKRKRQTPKLDAVVSEMKRCNPKELKTMTEKTMETKYGASRDTCRKARDKVLSADVERQ